MSAANCWRFCCAVAKAVAAAGSSAPLVYWKQCVAWTAGYGGRARLRSSLEKIAGMPRPSVENSPPAVASVAGKVGDVTGAAPAGGGTSEMRPFAGLNDSWNRLAGFTVSEGRYGTAPGALRSKLSVVIEWLLV